MDYSSTLNFLFSQLPQFQKIGSKAYKANLNNITKICELLGNPHLNLRTIHVAGSNGKGSTSHMLASVLQEAGYKVGLYTSPHLKDFRERIKINGKPISKKKVVQFVGNNKELFNQLKPSFFEWTVGLAFHHFSESNTDINIIETGLGGRLDSTNIIFPLVSVITNISLEHTAILGNSLKKIAQEKGGIIKPETPIVIGKIHPETKPVFCQIAKENKSPIYFSEEFTKETFELDLKGNIQQENAKTCVQTIELLQIKGWEIPATSIKRGLGNVIKNTLLLGRFQTIETSPLLIFDSAHNPHGIQILIEEIVPMDYEKLHVVIGISKEKDYKKIIELFPKETWFYFCSSTNPRVLNGEKLQELASFITVKGETFNKVKDGIETAKKNASNKDIILVTGSNFIIADAL